jgi:hypothetical protein
MSHVLMEKIRDIRKKSSFLAHTNTTGVVSCYILLPLSDDIYRIAYVVS